MSAYMIVDLDVRDSGALDEYRRAAVPLLARHGGRALVRFGAFEVLDGDWTPKRILVLEFATMVALKGWWDSDDYRPLKEMRRRVSKANVIAVEGV